MIFAMYMLLGSLKANLLYISCIDALTENVSPEFTIPTIWGVFGQNIPGWLSILVSVSITIYVTNSAKKSTERHIKAVEKASLAQINETRYWIDLKRKQLLKLLIEELKANAHLLETITAQVSEGKYHGTYDDIVLVIMEKCMADTPIDDEQLNSELLSLYKLLKVCKNRINAGQLSISVDAVSMGKDIASKYLSIKLVLEEEVHNLESYERSIELHRPAQ